MVFQSILEITMVMEVEFGRNSSSNLNVPYRLHLERDQIDNPHKKKAQKVFRESFSVTLHFKGK